MPHKNLKSHSIFDVLFYYHKYNKVDDSYNIKKSGEEKHLTSLSLISAGIGHALNDDTELTGIGE